MSNRAACSRSSSTGSWRNGCFFWPSTKETIRRKYWMTTLLLHLPMESLMVCTGSNMTILLMKTLSNLLLIGWKCVWYMYPLWFTTFRHFLYMMKQKQKEIYEHITLQINECLLSMLRRWQSSFDQVQLSYSASSIHTTLHGRPKFRSSLSILGQCPLNGYK